MHSYSNVKVILLDGQKKRQQKGNTSTVTIEKDPKKSSYTILVKEDTSSVVKTSVDEALESVRTGLTGIVISLPKQKNLSYLYKFANEEDASHFNKLLARIKLGKNVKDSRTSHFEERTEKSSAESYFEFYGHLSEQQNMLQDCVRTTTYQRAIFDNSVDFAGKVVLDVGAGSGILSFFAAQAGALKVYAIEASCMAQHAKTLVENNQLSHRIQVIAGKIEDITLPERVDVIISEPMGYMLYNERMIETFLYAKKFLKPNGKMYPSTGHLYVAPFTDAGLYTEMREKCHFWCYDSFYGINLSSLHEAALNECFKQPIIEHFNMEDCLATPIKHSVNYQKATEEDLHEIKIPLAFRITNAAVVHGLAFWFDVAFDGTSSQVWLSTSPNQPLTQWSQTRCLFAKPLIVNQGQMLKGHVILNANRKQSYDVDIFLEIDGTKISVRNLIDLKNPYVRTESAPRQSSSEQQKEASLHGKQNPPEVVSEVKLFPMADPKLEKLNINSTFNPGASYGYTMTAHPNRWH